MFLVCCWCGVVCWRYVVGALVACPICIASCVYDVLHVLSCVGEITGMDMPKFVVCVETIVAFQRVAEQGNGRPRVYDVHYHGHNFGADT